MNWNISVSGQKKNIESFLEAEIEKYASVNYYNGHLLTIKPAALDMIKDFESTDTIAITATGGDRSTLGTRYAQTITVSVF